MAIRLKHFFGSACELLIVQTFAEASADSRLRLTVSRRTVCKWKTFMVANLFHLQVIAVLRAAKAKLLLA